MLTQLDAFALLVKSPHFFLSPNNRIFAAYAIP